MNDLPAVGFPNRIVNASRFQIESVVAGQGQQVNAESRQRIERFGRSEKSSAFVDRLALFGYGGFEVGEHYIALQQPLNHRYRSRSGPPDIRPDHRLPR